MPKIWYCPKKKWRAGSIRNGLCRFLKVEAWRAWGVFGAHLWKKYSANYASKKCNKRMVFVCCILLSQLNVMWCKAMQLIHEFEYICECVNSWIILIACIHVFMRTYLCVVFVCCTIKCCGNRNVDHSWFANVSSRLMQVYAHMITRVCTQSY